MDPITAIVNFVGGLIDTPAEQQDRQNVADANKIRQRELEFKQKELQVKAVQQQQFLLFGIVGVVIVGGIYLLKD